MDRFRSYENIRGPEGQLVVLVPTRQRKFEGGVHENNCKRACKFLLFFLGGLFMLDGIVLASLYFTLDSVDFLLNITLIFLGIGGLLLLPPTIMCYRRHHHHQAQIERYMHRDDPSQRQAAVPHEQVPQSEVDPEAFLQNYFRMCRTSEVPVPDTPLRGQMASHPSAPSQFSVGRPRGQMTSSSSAPSRIPMGPIRTDISGLLSPNQASQRGQTDTYLTPANYPSYPSSLHTSSPLRQTQDHHSLSHNQLLSPGRTSTGRISPGRTSPGRISPGRTSPYHPSPPGLSFETNARRLSTIT